MMSSLLNDVIDLLLTQTHDLLVVK